MNERPCSRGNDEYFPYMDSPCSPKLFKIKRQFSTMDYSDNSIVQLTPLNGGKDVSWNSLGIRHYFCRRVLYIRTTGFDFISTSEYRSSTDNSNNKKRGALSKSQRQSTGVVPTTATTTKRGALSKAGVARWEPSKTY